ncbi:MAG TPA: VCBS repeat-containing protein [Gemmatimonadales bacterium]|nr:VCBS repeat-containing protein [Gemmatimonadales bacterium]
MSSRRACPRARQLPLLTLLLAWAGCSPSGRAPAAVTSAAVEPQRAGTSPPIFTRSIDPFPVVDTEGDPYPLAFLGGYDHPRPQLVDIRGTGLPDLFIQEYTGELSLFTRSGAGDSLRWQWQTDRYQDLDIGEWYRFADVDGDSLPDLFAESRYSYIRYYHNAGIRGSPRFVVVADTLKDESGTPIYADRQNIAQFADLDCNGRMDMMLGRVDGTIARYELQTIDSAGTPKFRLITDFFEDIRIIGQRASLHGANTLAVADLDRDGDPDILWGDFFEPGLLWLRNVGTCGHLNFHGERISFPQNAPLETSGYNAPAFGDLRGAGRLDLVVGVLGGAFNPIKTSRDNLYELDQSGPTAWNVRSTRLLNGIDLGSESVPAFADLDGDGDSDLVVGTKIDPDDIHQGALYWFENIGSRTAPALALRGRLKVEPAFHYAPAFGDLDGDGKPDLILGQFHDAIALYHNAGVDSTGPRFLLIDSAVARLPHGSNAVPALVDIDGDGDLDLFVGESSGRVLYFRNEGTPGTPRFVLFTDDFLEQRLGRRIAPRFADLFGDSLPSLIVGTERGAPAIFRNLGSRSAPRFIPDSSLVLDLPPYSTPAFADLWGTGVMDLLCGGAGGGLVYYRGRH